MIFLQQYDAPESDGRPDERARPTGPGPRRCRQVLAGGFRSPKPGKGNLADHKESRLNTQVQPPAIMQRDSERAA